MQNVEQIKYYISLDFKQIKEKIIRYGVILVVFIAVIFIVGYLIDNYKKDSYSVKKYNYRKLVEEKSTTIGIGYSNEIKRDISYLFLEMT